MSKESEIREKLVFCIQFLRPAVCEHKQTVLDWYVTLWEQNFFLWWVLVVVVSWWWFCCVYQWEQNVISLAGIGTIGLGASGTVCLFSWTAPDFSNLDCPYQNPSTLLQGAKISRKLIKKKQTKNSNNSSSKNNPRWVRLLKIHLKSENLSVKSRLNAIVRHERDGKTEIKIIMKRLTVIMKILIKIVIVGARNRF